LQLFHAGLDWLASHPLGPLVYIGLFVLRPVLLLPASLLSIAAGYCFGPGWGLLWAHTAGVVASLVGYAMGSWLGLAALSRLEWATRGLALMRENCMTAVMCMRWCFLPYDAISYLAGVAGVRLAPFLLASFLGNLPGTTSCVLLGGSVQHPWRGGMPTVDLRLQVASCLIMLAMLGVARRVRRRISPGASSAEPRSGNT
jgi:uncharacterized membrane protein YdjX (TVP38/TMEM64 family)